MKLGLSQPYCRESSVQSLFGNFEIIGYQPTHFMSIYTAECWKKIEKNGNIDTNWVRIVSFVFQ